MADQILAEYQHLQPEAIAQQAIWMIEQGETCGERALALAIVLRDRAHGEASDPTDRLLLEMLVEELAAAYGPSLKQCLAALLEKCQPTGGVQ